MLIKLSACITLILALSFNSSGQEIEGVKIADSSVSIDLGFENPVNINLNSNPRLIMNGEIHNVHSNHILKYQLLKKLYFENDVRYFIIELGPTSAYLLNRYLNNGDESVFANNSYLRNEMAFWEKLKNFNDSLDDNEKIEILGFDFDRFEPYKNALHSLLSENDRYTQQTNQKIRNFHSAMDKADANDIPELNIQLRSILNLRDSLFLKDIAENSVCLELIALNKVPRTTRIKRDKQAYQNIVRFYSSFNRGNFFGQFGISHARKGRRNNLASLLDSKKESPFRNSVICIEPQYVNCKTVYQGETEELTNFGILNLTGAGFKNLEKLEAEITVIKIEGMSKRLGKAVDYLMIVKDQMGVTN